MRTSERLGGSACSSHSRCWSAFARRFSCAARTAAVSTASGLSCCGPGSYACSCANVREPLTSYARICLNLCLQTRTEVQPPGSTST